MACFGAVWAALASLLPASPPPRTVVLPIWTFRSFRLVTTIEIRAGPRLFRLHPVYAGMDGAACDALLEKLALLAKRDAALELDVVDDPEEPAASLGRVVRLRARGAREALYSE